MNLKKINNSPSTIPTLFIHGFLGDNKDWDKLISQNNIHAITIDLPGHGENTDLNYKDITHFSLELLDKLQNEKHNLVAYSMGGRVAMHLLLLRPELFNNITIISASPYCPNPTERLSEDQKLLSGNYAHLLNRWYRQPLFGKIQSHKKYNELIQYRLLSNQKLLQNALNILSIAKQGDLREGLLKTEKQINFLSGEYDQKYCKIGAKLAANPNIKHTIIKECGHNVIFEKPDLIAKIL